MYDYFNGKLTELTPTYAVVETGGVGYLLHISLHTYSQLSLHNSVLLYAHLVVREDAHVLFGFSEKAERELFRHLITVSGIGANTARMMLSSLSPLELTEAIIGGNVVVLKGIKGIGIKTAQRVILDLKDKLAKGTEASTVSILTEIAVNREEAVAALIMLGFAKNAVEKTVDAILKKEKNLSVEELVKISLKQM